MKDIRTEVKETLERKGLKHKWIYSQIGISKSHFSHWINGERDISSSHISTIMRILDRLNMSDELILILAKGDRH